MVRSEKQRRIEEEKRQIEELVRKEFARMDARARGGPMTLAEMEDYVTESGERFRQAMLDEMVKEQRLRVVAEKKTVHGAEKNVSSKGSVAEF